MKFEVRHFHAGYGRVEVVRDVNMSVADGETLAILGRNGMGKSTLLKGLVGLLPDVRGSARLDDRETVGRATNEIIRRGVAYAGQDGAIFGDLTVQENLDAATLWIAPDARREGRILSFFPVLDERRSQRAGTLSGGEQRMLALCRVLLASPGLIVLDEISAGLQPAKVAAVEEALRWERQTRGTTILMVEQNLGLSLRLANRIAVMKLGKIVLDAPADRPGLADELATQLAP